MAFKDIDQMLINECVKDIADLEKIKELMADGADINAFNKEHQKELYDEILDFYIFEGRERQVNLPNLFKVTELFVENGLILNQKPDDSHYFLLNHFQYLPPEKICVDIFKMLLEKCSFSFEDLDDMTADAAIDLYLGVHYYYFEKTQNYSEKDCLEYYLELIYWACAYNVKTYPEKYSQNILRFNWFNRERNNIEFVQKNRSASVFVEDLETHTRAEIDSCSVKC